MFLLSLSAIVAFLFSFSAKLIADAYLHERMPIIGSFAGLLYAKNPGVAFGLQLGHWQDLIILCALALVIVAAVRAERSRTGDAGFGLIIGGALGNVLDRLNDGFVTDFFQIGTFPIFNVADSCITIGVCLLLVQSLILVRSKHL